MGRKRKLKSPPNKLRAQQLYRERQHALGRKCRKYWATDDENAVIKRVVKHMLVELRRSGGETNNAEPEEAKTKRSACL